jgi:AcrR family transcriptional regulator
MPKIVDHAERRRLIADALLRIAAERGLESVSLRHVAAEAGVSTGMVQHYFKTKDEMMTFALDVVRDSVRARLAASVSAENLAASPTAFVRSLLSELLPLDRRRRDEARVTVAFLAYAPVRPRVARAMRKETAELLRLLTEGIAGAQAEGRVRVDLNPGLTAKGLLALMEGLGLHVLFGHYGPDDAMSVFDAYVDGIVEQ